MSAASQSFATLFDRRYLTRGLALYGSLHDTLGRFNLFVLCLDAPTHDALRSLQLPGVTAVRLDEFECAEPELGIARANRTWTEYCYTLSASFTHFLMTTRRDLDRITYLDADLYFFASPQILLDEQGDAAIGIVEHRFSGAYRRRDPRHAALGRFNVSWVSFRRDAEALACLARWRDQCIEATPGFPHDGLFGDQKYLDEWPERYRSLHILVHPGANLAPFNLHDRTLTALPHGVSVDGQPLVFYHYAQLRCPWRGVLQTGVPPLSRRRRRLVVDRIYRPYIGALHGWAMRLRDGMPATVAADNAWHRDMARTVTRHGSLGQRVRIWIPPLARNVAKALLYRDLIWDPRPID